jgi:hypothetical protein
MNQREGDRREKHPESRKNAAISMCLEGCGLHRIGLLLPKIFRVKINYQLIIHWLMPAGMKLIPDKKSSNTADAMDNLKPNLVSGAIAAFFGSKIGEPGFLGRLRLKPRAGSGPYPGWR